MNIYNIERTQKTINNIFLIILPIAFVFTLLWTVFVSAMILYDFSKSLSALIRLDFRVFEIIFQFIIFYIPYIGNLIIVIKAKTLKNRAILSIIISIITIFTYWWFAFAGGLASFYIGLIISLSLVSIIFNSYILININKFQKK